MIDPRKLIAEQIGNLVIVNSEQAARIEALEAALAAAQSKPSAPPAAAEWGVADSMSAQDRPAERRATEPEPA
jgi:hypothetical protein